MPYALPIAVLLLTIALFFLAARGRYSEFGWLQGVVRIVVTLPLLLSGIVLHFFRIADVIAIIPPGFPDPRLLAIASGVLEIAGAIALWLPRLRRTAAVLIALMMVAIFPANIYAAGKIIGGMQMPGIAVRTAMQAVYILLVLLAGFGLPWNRRHASR